MSSLSIMGIAASCILAVAAHSAGPGSGGLDELDPGLPSNVRIEAINYTSGLSRPPLSHMVVEIGPDWVKSECWLDQAGFGLQIHAVTLDDARTSFRYNIAERRGTTNRRVPAYRPSRDEFLTTPIGPWRALRGLAADGHALKFSSDGSSATVEVDGAPINLGAMRFEFARGETTELRSVDIRNGTKGMRFDYEDWRDVAGGRHPHRIHLHLYDLSRPAAENRDSEPSIIIVSDIRPLFDLATPARWPLPETAVITDLDTGISTDPSGRVVNADLPAATRLVGFTSARSSTRWTNAAVGVGAVLLAAAGLLLLRRVGVKR